MKAIKEWIGNLIIEIRIARETPVYVSSIGKNESRAACLTVDANWANGHQYKQRGQIFSNLPPLFLTKLIHQLRG